MPSQNTTIFQDPASLSHDDLVDEYEKISQRYTDVKQSEDSCQQQIYEIKRQLELSGKRESYLTQELETITEVHDGELAKLREKQRADAEEMRQRLAEAKETIGGLELELERMKKEQLEKVTKVVPVVAVASNESILSESHREQLDKLEAENTGLIELCEELKEKYMDALKQVADKEVSNERNRLFSIWIFENVSKVFISLLFIRVHFVFSY